MKYPHSIIVSASAANSSGRPSRFGNGTEAASASRTCCGAAASSGVSKIPGITLYLQPVQELGIEDRISRTQYQFTLTSPDFNELSTWAPRLMETLQAHPALADVASDLQNQGLQAHLQIDRNAAARLGIPVSAIADAGAIEEARDLARGLA